MISEIIIDRRVLSQFKKQALKAFPRETIACLWGRVKGDQARVHGITKLTHIRADAESIDYEGDPEENLEGTGMVVWGELHSHPSDAPVPSDTDWNQFLDVPDDEPELVIMGICGVRKTPRRRFISWSFYNDKFQKADLTIAE